MADKRLQDVKNLSQDVNTSLEKISVFINVKCFSFEDIS